MATKGVTDVMICRAVYQIHQTGFLPSKRFYAALSLLQETTGQSVKECQAAINRAINSGLVDWGIHNSIGWLTKDGIKLLNDEQ